jgi:hypothetical protein
MATCGKAFSTALSVYQPANEPYTILWVCNDRSRIQFASTRYLRTARTSAYFSTVPFAGTGRFVRNRTGRLDRAFCVAGVLMVVGVWLHVTNTNQWDTNTFTITTRPTILRGGKGIYQRGEERSDILLPRRFWRSKERMSSTSKSNHCPCSDDQSIVQVLCPTGVDDELYVRLDSQPLGKLCLISKLKSHLGPRSRGTCPTEGLLGGDARCPSVHATRSR